jgi:hypothetical protein
MVGRGSLGPAVLAGWEKAQQALPENAAPGRIESK